jgi:hypothetical protein
LPPENISEKSTIGLMEGGKMRGWYSDRDGHSFAAKMGWEEHRIRSDTSRPAKVKDLREANHLGNKGLYLNIILKIAAGEAGTIYIPFSDADLERMFDFKKVLGIVYHTFKPRVKEI